MFSKPFRSFGRTSDGMDEHLYTVGLWRKAIAKDDSSLYRAVSEQVFHTQAYHERVKNTCQKYIQQHHAELSDDWIGPLEIKAMSILYQRDFIIYKQPGKDPVNVTGFGFKDQILLCLTGGEHYDSIYTRGFVETAAICQSILYETLYEKVYGVEQAAKKGQDMIGAKPPQIAKHTNNMIAPASDKHSHACCSIYEPTLVYSVNELKPSGHMTPFPYKVAKSLSADVFRNVEYDAWLESKKEEQALAYHEYHLSSSSGSFMPGDKCLVVLDGHDEHQFNAHVQEILTESSSAVVFVEELGRREVVQWSKMTSLPQISCAESAWRKRGKKKFCDCTRTFMENDNFIGHKSRLVHSQYVGRRMRINSAGLPIKLPAHDICLSYVHGRPVGKSTNQVKEPFSNLGPRMKNSHRQRYNSEGHYSDELEEKQLDDSVFNEQQEQRENKMDSGSALESLQWAACNEPVYGDTAEAVTAGQPVAGNCDDGEIVNVPFIQQSKSQLDSFIPSPSPSTSSPAACTMVRGISEGLSSPVIQPLLRPPPGYIIAIPFHNVGIIPVGDNFGGPINTNVLPSLDPSGQDLPLHDNSTMRFFFNLGVQYYRSVVLVQQHVATTAAGPPYFNYPGTNGTSMCLSQTGMMVAPEIYAASEGDTFAGGSFCQSGVTPPGAVYFSSSPQCPPMPPFFQYGGSSVQYQPAAM